MSTTTLTPGFLVTAEQKADFFTDVRNQVVVMIPVSLREMKITSFASIEIPGIGNLMADSEAINQLFAIVGITKLTRDNLLNTGFGFDDITELSNALRQASKDRKIGAIIDTRSGNITSFSNSIKPVLPANMFVDHLSEMLNKNKYNIVHAGLDEKGQINVIARPEDYFIVKGLTGEEHRGGISATLTHKGAFIEAYYERLVCLNGAIGRRKLGGFSVTQEKDAMKFLRALSDFKGFDQDLFQDRVKTLNSTQASLFEVKTTVNMLDSLFVDGSAKKENPIWDLITTEIPVDAMSEIITKKTGIKKPFKAIDDNILRGLNAPMTNWDLVNAVTQIGTHIERRTNNTVNFNKRRMAISNAGAMIFEHTPDRFMPIPQMF